MLKILYCLYPYSTTEIPILYDGEDKMAFKTPEGEELFQQAYSNNLKRWNVSYEILNIPTTYGSTHIIASGETKLPPVIMLHGAGMGSTIWYANIESLSKIRRVYAVDAIGDMNKSEPLRSISDPEDMGKWMAEILDHLGIEKQILSVILQVGILH